MCGIIGYVGEKKNALKVLITGLKALEYRGYDSSGIAYFKNQKIEVAKEKGKIEKLEKILNLSTSSNIGIAHTRWATCGIPDKINAHPHSSGKITIVHNGIIENYEQLKKELEKEGYHFISQTDSETIAVLLDKYYKESQDILKSIIKTKKRLTGSYALAILCEDIPSKIFAIRKDNPLIIAKSNDASFIASDIPAILTYTNQYYILDENEIAILSKDKIDFKNDTLETINKKVLTFNGDKNSSTKGDFSHYMLKEIFEEKDVIKRIMKDYNDIDQLIQNLSFLKKYKKFDIVACGSAYHIGVIAKYLIEEHISIPVNVEVASEYRYKNNFLDNESLAIFISQSGETADTLACVRKVKEKNIDTLGIINVEESSIAREVDYAIYTKAGPEIAVATTKAFLAQLIIIVLITLYLGYEKKYFTKEFLNERLNELSNMDSDIDTILNSSYEKMAKTIAKHQNVFFLGRNIDYGIALEASLKLKEISYIHSEAYPAGELKHGTISLIEKNTPVISILTKNSTFDKTINNIKEVKTRGAYSIIISTKKIADTEEIILIPEKNELLLPILAIIPLQLLAYHVANIRGCDIDKPRNLAKSVTVE